LRLLQQEKRKTCNLAALELVKPWVIPGWEVEIIRVVTNLASPLQVHARTGWSFWKLPRPAGYCKVWELFPF
jgi:hypothetical protein